jgi:ComF family protein
MPAFHHHLASSLRRSIGVALDCLMPPRCPCCGTFVQGEQNLCATCFAALDFIVAPFCQRCGVPFALTSDAGTAQLCESCMIRSAPFSRVRAAFSYDHAAQRLILPFKHGDRTDLAALLGRLMARAGRTLLDEADLLLPVPLHPRRLAERRYNQSALLAADLARRTARPWAPDTLRRNKRTVPLGELSAAARRDTVRDAFLVQSDARASLVGRRVLLIDDVMTSGATLSACSETLLQAGAVRVDALVAARVPDPRRRGAWQTSPALAETD